MHAVIVTTGVPVQGFSQHMAVAGLIMPQSHCPESVPERARIDHSSWFE